MSRDTRKSAQKFGPPKHPIQVEATLKTLQPTHTHVHRRMNEYASRVLSTTTDRDLRAGVAAEAAHDDWQHRKEIIADEFKDGFDAWMAGNSKWNNKKCFTPWGRQPLFYLPGVVPYYDRQIDVHEDFRKCLLDLERNGPQNLNQSWLYYKYIVRAREWLEGHENGDGELKHPPWFDLAGKLDFLDKFSMDGQETEHYDDPRAQTQLGGKEDSIVAETELSSYDSSNTLPENTANKVLTEYVQQGKRRTGKQTEQVSETDRQLRRAAEAYVKEQKRWEITQKKLERQIQEQLQQTQQRDIEIARLGGELAGAQQANQQIVTASQRPVQVVAPEDARLAEGLAGLRVELEQHRASTVAAVKEVAALQTTVEYNKVASHVASLQRQLAVLNGAVAASNAETKAQLQMTTNHLTAQLQLAQQQVETVARQQHQDAETIYNGIQQVQKTAAATGVAVKKTSGYVKDLQDSNADIMELVNERTVALSQQLGIVNENLDPARIVESLEAFKSDVESMTNQEDVKSAMREYLNKLAEYGDGQHAETKEWLTQVNRAVAMIAGNQQTLLESQADAIGGMMDVETGTSELTKELQNIQRRLDVLGKKPTGDPSDVDKYLALQRQMRDMQTHLSRISKNQEAVNDSRERVRKMREVPVRPLPPTPQRQQQQQQQTVSPPSQQDVAVRLLETKLEGKLDVLQQRVNQLEQGRAGAQAPPASDPRLEALVNSVERLQGQLAAVKAPEPDRRVYEQLRTDFTRKIEKLDGKLNQANMELSALRSQQGADKERIRELASQVERWQDKYERLAADRAAIVQPVQQTQPIAQQAPAPQQAPPVVVTIAGKTDTSAATPAATIDLATGEITRLQALATELHRQREEAMVRLQTVSVTHNDDISRLNTEKNTLAAQLTAATDRYEQLKTASEDARAQLKDAAESRKAEMQANLDQARQQAQRAEEELRLLRTQQQSLESQAVMLQGSSNQTVAHLQRELHETTRQLQITRQEAAAAANNAGQQASAQYTLQTQQHETRLQQAQSEIATLQQQLMVAQARAQQSAATPGDTFTQVDVESDASEIASELNSARQRAQDLERAYTELQTEYQQASERNNAALNSLRASTVDRNEYARLEAQASTYSQAIAAKQQELLDARLATQNSIAEKDNEITRLNGERLRAQQQVTALLSQITGLQANLEQAQAVDTPASSNPTQITELEKERRELRKQVKELEEKIRVTTDLATDLQEDIGREQSKLQEAQEKARADVKATKAETLKKIAAELERQEKELSAKYTKHLQTQQARLESRIKELTDTNADLETQIASASTEDKDLVTRLNADLTSKRAEIEQLRNQMPDIDALQQELAEEQRGRKAAADKLSEHIQLKAIVDDELLTAQTRIGELEAAAAKNSAANKETVTKLTGDIANYKSLVTRNEQANKRLQTQLGEALAKVGIDEATAEELKELRETRARLQESIRAKESTIASLDSDKAKQERYRQEAAEEFHVKLAQYEAAGGQGYRPTDFSRMDEITLRKIAVKKQRKLQELKDAVEELNGVQAKLKNTSDEQIGRITSLQQALALNNTELTTANTQIKTLTRERDASVLEGKRLAGIISRELGSEILQLDGIPTDYVSPKIRALTQTRDNEIARLNQQIQQLESVKNSMDQYARERASRILPIDYNVRMMTRDARLYRPDTLDIKKKEAARIAEIFAEDVNRFVSVVADGPVNTEQATAIRANAADLLLALSRLRANKHTSPLLDSASLNAKAIVEAITEKTRQESTDAPIVKSVDNVLKVLAESWDTASQQSETMDVQYEYIRVSSTLASYADVKELTGGLRVAPTRAELDDIQVKAIRAGVDVVARIKEELRNKGVAEQYLDQTNLRELLYPSDNPTIAQAAARDRILGVLIASSQSIQSLNEHTERLMGMERANKYISQIRTSIPSTYKKLRLIEAHTTQLEEAEAVIKRTAEAAGTGDRAAAFQALSQEERAEFVQAAEASKQLRRSIAELATMVMSEPVMITPGARQTMSDELDDTNLVQAMQTLRTAASLTGNTLPKIIVRSDGRLSYSGFDITFTYKELEKAGYRQPSFIALKADREKSRKRVLDPEQEATIQSTTGGSYLNETDINWRDIPSKDLLNQSLVSITVPAPTAPAITSSSSDEQTDKITLDGSDLDFWVDTKGQIVTQNPEAVRQWWAEYTRVVSENIEGYVASMENDALQPATQSRYQPQQLLTNAVAANGARALSAFAEFSMFEYDPVTAVYYNPYMSGNSYMASKVSVPPSAVAQQAGVTDIAEPTQLENRYTTGTRANGSATDIAKQVIATIDESRSSKKTLTDIQTQKMYEAFAYIYRRDYGKHAPYAAVSMQIGADIDYEKLLAAHQARSTTNTQKMLLWVLAATPATGKQLEQQKRLYRIISLGNEIGNPLPAKLPSSKISAPLPIAMQDARYNDGYFGALDTRQRIAFAALIRGAKRSQRYRKLLEKVLNNDPGAVRELLNGENASTGTVGSFGLQLLDGMQVSVGTE